MIFERGAHQTDRSCRRIEKAALYRFIKQIHEIESMDITALSRQSREITSILFQLELQTQISRLGDLFRERRSKTG